MNIDASTAIARFAALADSARRALQVANFPSPPASRSALTFSQHELDCRQFVAFDLETTGTDVHLDSPVEIGAVRFDFEGNVLDRFETLVDPGSRPVSPHAAVKHGLDSTRLAGQPSLQEALAKFLKFLGGEETVVLQHSNCYFDARMLSVALYDYQMEWPVNVIVDTMKLSRRLVKKSPRIQNPDTGSYSYSLAILCGAFGIAQDQPHRALPDAELTMRLFLELCHADPSGAVRHSGNRLQRVSDLFDKNLKPVFFTDLPVLKQFPAKYRDILKAINTHSSLEIDVRESNGGTCLGIVKPLWVTGSSSSSSRKDLVYRFSGEEARGRIPLDNLVSWQVI